MVQNSSLASWSVSVAVPWHPTPGAAASWSPGLHWVRLVVTSLIPLPRFYLRDGIIELQGERRKKHIKEFSGGF